MKNEFLNKVWNMQDKNLSISNAEDIIVKAKTQRKNQLFTIIILSLTVAVLIAFTIYVLPKKWNNFTLGLTLMVFSLVFRILLEFVSIYKRESKLISMDNKSYSRYLEKYYKIRLIINYIITPLSLTFYCYGFYLLTPYFKNEFSEGFYNYILISGIVTLLFIIALIVNSIIREHRFLEHLKSIK